ncbi:MAG: hypothetical protein R2744_02695 [Bacteroidales bacterium]
MGGDNLYTLHKWKNVDRLVSSTPLYVYPRKEEHSIINPALEDIIKRATVTVVKAP